MEKCYEIPTATRIGKGNFLLFGSTYVCESAFSTMKYLKNEYRSRLWDGSLESQLKLMVSKEVPDFARLVARMQDQGSH